jgi:hypothetical protein
MEFPIEALGLLGANTRELSSALAQRLDNSILGSFLSVNLPSMAIGPHTLRQSSQSTTSAGSRARRIAGIADCDLFVPWERYPSQQLRVCNRSVTILPQGT